jgi:hypothetical protein
MKGLMMDWPLVVPNILHRAAQIFPRKEIVTRRAIKSCKGASTGS